MPTGRHVHVHQNQPNPIQDGDHAAPGQPKLPMRPIPAQENPIKESYGKNQEGFNGLLSLMNKTNPLSRSRG